MTMKRSLAGTKINGVGSCEITDPVTRRDLEECAEVCGNYFFEPATMRFFRSRISSAAYADGKGVRTS